MGLNLLANDAEDLKVLSAALQDAILRIGDIRYEASARSVTLRLSRYRHEADRPSRIECGLRVDSVTRMQSAGLDRSNPDAFAVLLGLSFDEGDAPEGVMKISLAGGGTLKLDVECLDLLLSDVGEPRRVKSRPDHETA